MKNGYAEFAYRNSLNAYFKNIKAV